MNNPSVTILTPCYNVGRFLPKYFETVLGQTYGNLQVVLIDDGSKDDTWTVMQEYAVRDSRVEIYRQENQGVAATRNNLLDKAKGDYVLFVDSDDWIEPDMVEYLLKTALEHGSKFVMCDRVINDAEPKEGEPGVRILSQEQAVHDFLRHEYFVGSLWNKLFDNSLLKGLRFNDAVSYGEDALFCWGVLQKVDKVVVTDKQLYHYRMNEESISHNSFGPNKLSGHLTWKLISREVDKEWPRYSTLAKARWAVQDAQLIRNAAHSGYSYDENIESLQNTVIEFQKHIGENHISSLRMRLYAFVASRFYSFARFF